MKRVNVYLIEYALNALFRQKLKNIFIAIVFTVLTFLLSAVFFITNSIKFELGNTLESLPQVIVQEVNGGRHSDIKVDAVDKILSIKGVNDAIARVWGYYYFENVGVNFTILGIDKFESQYEKGLQNVADKFELEDSKNNSFMVVGEGVKKSMNKNYYKEYFNFIKADGSFKKVYIAGEFKPATKLESNDMIVMSKNSVREILGMPENKATDIVVSIANKNEVKTVVQKIKMLFPNAKVVSKEDMKVSYENIFNYKSGIFLALFVISLFTFFIIIYDKLSGLNSQEKREVGILKALGWRVNDVLKEKFYESFIISLFSYLSGVILALGFVYIFQAPLLRDIFTGYSGLKAEFELPFVFDIQTLFLVFFLSVPVYIAATIIPAWRAATLEADEVIR